MNLKYTESGYMVISPGDDCKMIVDAMLTTGYYADFCLARDFEPEFIKRLMEAGFLVMSASFDDGNEIIYTLLPKLHIERSALFFNDLHIKKSIRRFLPCYELRADAEFDRIINSCVEKHGADWLTAPLVDCIKKIRYQRQNHQPVTILKPQVVPSAYPASFGLYRDGELVAGEFGVVYGNVYTSYSGYSNENNAGTVQLILTTKYLQENGFSFFDLGMPLHYKTDLGATIINMRRFVQLFRMGNKIRRVADFKC